MTEKDWVLFKTIADEKNITKAAEKLYISQPAITYRIKMMEKEIGAKLLIRTSHGVLLTPEGECFLDYSREWSSIDSRRRMLSGLLSRYDSRS